MNLTAPLPEIPAHRHAKIRHLAELAAQKEIRRVALRDLSRIIEHGTPDERAALPPESVDAGLTIIRTSRCPVCGAGRTKKKSGTYRDAGGVFVRHVYDCGSELTLDGFNHRTGRCR